ncbi:HD domain-containing protein [Staphylococcus carnosus]|uniref:HD domain-containing protein n=1 Tax=Staphylococcus carnosus TaxID=1281 RepID=UPI00081AA4AF|nr:HD domain-containing protein [Staphylococcus carnosus]ANZ32888.1 phosphohydrolase [Staphylococcus carnosus]UTB85019.1 phosphohydrolase [Staphylococcus carnosus]
MNQYQQLKEAEKYMKSHHSDDATGHDIEHVMRVVKMALFIAEQEGGGNPYMIQMAALLHDTVDSKLTDESKAYQDLDTFLDKIDVSAQMKDKILEIIEHTSYRSGKNNDIEMSREGYIVRDADRLDAIGAIGIARTFQFAGHFNEPMWVGEIPDSISGEYDLDDYSPSAIKHFYDKLFKLKDLMHSETAQAIAEERHRFMEYFVAQFFKEWDFTN